MEKAQPIPCKENLIGPLLRSGTLIRSICVLSCAIVTWMIRIVDSRKTKNSAKAPVQWRKSGAGENVSRRDFGLDAEIFEGKVLEYSKELQSRIPFGTNALHMVPHYP